MLWSKTASRVRLGLDRDLKGGGSSPCGHPGKILSNRVMKGGPQSRVRWGRGWGGQQRSRGLACLQ